ncbi:MAG: copper amine oxidase N-terminal domain-containing protein [Firmicutes bacterium]|nr:copper amine oxidase N-terminal domain-containing protein [Bacillota bacterium]
MWRKVAPVMVCLALLFIFAAAAQAGTQVIVDGKAVSFDTPPVLANGRMLVPLRSIFEALNTTVNWDGATQTITATKGDINIKLVVGGQAYKNDQAVALDVPAKLVDGRTLVPLRFVSEALGANVDWNNGVITITSAAAESAPAAKPLNNSMKIGLTIFGGSQASLLATEPLNALAESGRSDYQRFAEALNVLNESYVEDRNTQLDINLVWHKIEITNTGYTKQVKVSEQDMERGLSDVMNGEYFVNGVHGTMDPITRELYYKDGYVYFNIQNKKSKIALPLDRQANAAVSGFDKSKIRDVKVIGNSIYYTIDKSAIDFSYLDVMMNRLFANDNGIDVNYSDINCSTTIDNDGKLSAINMQFSAETSINEQAAIINCEVTTKITQPGNITIDFPDDLDSYTEVVPGAPN